MQVNPLQLALYDDAAWYDSTYRSRRQDVRYYAALAAAAGGPVLEYGVGSGRVALALARAGVEVCGVDASRPMLDRLREKLERAPKAVRKRVTTHHGDMRRVRLGESRVWPLVQGNGKRGSKQAGGRVDARQFRTELFKRGRPAIGRKLHPAILSRWQLQCERTVH